MPDNRPLTRPQQRGGAAIFAALLVVLVFFVPVLLWPAAAAAGLTFILVSWRSPNLAAWQRVTFALVGVGLVALAVLAPLDLYFSSVTIGNL